MFGEAEEFEANLDYKVRPCPPKQTKTKGL
jgi:hypothetical protein